MLGLFSFTEDLKDKAQNISPETCGWFSTPGDHKVKPNEYLSMLRCVARRKNVPCLFNY